MPNHVVNEIIFRDITEEQHAAITRAALNAAGDVDFSILLPIPLNAWMGNVGSNHQAAFHLTALDWCRDHWGTKWNAYHQGGAVFSDGTLTITFETAWRPPYGWLAALFNTVEIGFQHNWLDEGAERGVVGMFSTNPGDVLSHIGWREEPADDLMHRRLMVLHWGEETADAIEHERAATGEDSPANEGEGL
jgi:hypothetical protein